MTPEVKATITLPLAIIILGLLGYFVGTHALIVGWGLIIISLIAIIGSIWYALYTLFGGEV
jgi:xanthosine utilization system XapX-like protein